MTFITQADCNLMGRTSLQNYEVLSLLLLINIWNFFWVMVQRRCRRRRRYFEDVFLTLNVDRPTTKRHDGRARPHQNRRILINNNNNNNNNNSSSSFFKSTTTTTTMNINTLYISILIKRSNIFQDNNNNFNINISLFSKVQLQLWAQIHFAQSTKSISSQDSNIKKKKNNSISIFS